MSNHNTKYITYGIQIILIIIVTIFGVFGVLQIKDTMQMVRYSETCHKVYGQQYEYNNKLKNPACILKEYNYMEDRYKIIDVKILEVKQ